jgi:hypothetical protein
MKPIAIVIAAGLAFAATLQAAPAFATQIKRTFVSAVGNDSNVSTQCQPSAPCRTFAAAYSVTIADGEIDVLDPAGYGTLTITHGFTIQGHGWVAITAQSGDAITINAGANDKINLRGLSLDGAGAGQNGITLISAASLSIQDCLIRNFVSNGVNFMPNASSKLSVSNTVISDNGGSGIDITVSGSGTVNGVVDHVEMENNADRGLQVFDGGAATINVTVNDSVAAHNFVGIATNSPAAAAAVMVRNSTLVNNSFGVTTSGPGATLRLTRSTITGNGTGLGPFGGTLASYGDNNVDGNTTNGAPTSTIGYH